MLTLLVVSKLLHLAKANYGRYEFSKQFGNSIYDNSATDFHGFNGSDPLDDIDDGSFTDRGIYFNGVNQHASIHYPYYNYPTEFEENMSIVMWFLPLSTGSILSRYDLDSNYEMIHIYYNSITEYLQIDTYFTDNGSKILYPCGSPLSAIPLGKA